MLRLLMVGQESQALEELQSGLIQNDFACSLIPYDEAMVEKVTRQAPDLLLVEINGYLPASRMWDFVQRIKQESSTPVIGLVTRDRIDGIDGHLDMDDFVSSPYQAKELALRARRLLCKAGDPDGSEVIKCDGLVIDLARCEVTVDGRIVELTFKEYELLKFLASNKGRVFTRDVLLNRVWGYDYYGGDRTVDVHIRRLRSKIEGPEHSFIETVRHIGYRFTKDS